MRNALEAALQFIDRLFNRHKLMRRGIVLWAILAVSVAMYAIIPRITGDTGLVAALTAVIGLVGTAIAFYNTARDRENDRDSAKTDGRRKPAPGDRET